MFQFVNVYLMMVIVLDILRSVPCSMGLEWRDQTR